MNGINSIIKFFTGGTVLNIESYYNAGLQYLENQEYAKAYETFLEAVKSSHNNKENLHLKYFCEGMIHYEKAPKSSENKNPQEYLKALRCYLLAYDYGLEHFFLYYYLGDTAGKIGTGGKRNPFHKAVKYVYRSFGIQAFIRCTSILAEVKPESNLAQRALKKAATLNTVHHRYPRLLEEARNHTGELNEDILTGKKSCDNKEWNYFTNIMQNLLNPKLLAPTKKRSFRYTPSKLLKLIK